MTPEQFDQWIYLPENIQREYELIAGEPVEIGAIPYHLALMTTNIGFRISMHNHQHHLGYVTGARGVFCVGPDRYGPSVGYISRARQPEPCDGAHNPLAPDLAVEIMTPVRQIPLKIANYLAAGTVLWIILPDQESVKIHHPHQQSYLLGLDDVLDGGTVLPGFKLAVKDVFAD